MSKFFVSKHIDHGFRVISNRPIDLNKIRDALQKAKDKRLGKDINRST